MFKLEHPSNLITRMFILEYIKEIGPKALYEKANATERKDLFYKFTDESKGIEEVDINWESLLFRITLSQLEIFLSKFMTEIENIDALRQVALKARAEEKVQEEVATPTDINIYDMAQTEIRKNQNNSKLIY